MGGAAVAAIADGTDYTAAVEWSPAIAAGTFAYDTEYTATITLTAQTGYTFAGDYGDTAAIAAFTVDGETPTWISRSADGKELKFSVSFGKTVEQHDDITYGPNEDDISWK